MTSAARYTTPDAPCPSGSSSTIRVSRRGHLEVLAHAGESGDPGRDGRGGVTREGSLKRVMLLLVVVLIVVALVLLVVPFVPVERRRELGRGEHDHPGSVRAAPKLRRR